MQDKNKKIEVFKQAIGQVYSDLRKSNGDLSINKLANEYDIDKGTLSKIERGLYDCRLSTAWRIAEANGINFVEFADRLKKQLGDEFTFIDL